MDARNELEDASANLQALTGLGDSDVKKLENFAKEMATKPLEGTAIRIRSSVAEIMAQARAKMKRPGHQDTKRRCYNRPRHCLP